MTYDTHEYKGCQDAWKPKGESRANGWSERLFSRLVEARAEAEVRRLAAPRGPGAGVELSDGTVRVGATRLPRRRQRV
ncbi:hypothetical protein DYH09_16100 [bacterium CPR1]|nr:hypothetical protein [bacterium CPR1]